MEPDYLMNAASVLFLVCYVPELYANYKNKNANLYNLPEKVIMLAGTGLAFAYSVVKDDQALLLNYGPILGLDIIAFLMRLYYAWRNHATPLKYVEQKETAEQTTVTVNSESE